MQKREHVIHFMLQGHVHLSKKDYGFFHNLQRLVHDRNIVTTNQNKLFEKLLVKYSRQLNKLGKGPDTLMALPWNSAVVESSGEYTGVRVGIRNNLLFFKSPFSSKFLKVFKNVKDNPFLWDKNDRAYVASYSTNAFKILHRLLPLHFDDIRFDSDLSELLDFVKEYEGYIFKPTLKLVNSNLVVVGCNQVISDLLKDVNLEKTAACFYALSKLGVTIDESLTNTDELKFAASTTFNMDLRELNVLADYCEQAGIKHVVLASKVTFGNHFTPKVFMETLGNRGIECVTMTSRYGEFDHTLAKWVREFNPIFVQYHSANYSKIYDVKFSKYVVLKNSNTVDVR